MSDCSVPDEQLPPLSDERIRQFQDLTRNGPVVVAMAQEIERLRRGMRELVEMIDTSLDQIEIDAQEVGQSCRLLTEGNNREHR